MHIPSLREIFLPSSQYIVGVCNQITLLVLYCIGSRLVTFLKVMNAPIQVSDIFFYPFGSLGSSVLVFRYSFFLFVKSLLPSRLTFFRLYTFLWFGCCNYCILVCFLWTINREHSSSCHDLCRFNSYNRKLSLAEIWIFSDILFNVFPDPIYVLAII